MRRKTKLSDGSDIHLNPVRASLVKNVEDWKYSSYNIFARKNTHSLIKHEIITEQIANYSEFVKNFKEEKNISLKDFLF